MKGRSFAEQGLSPKERVALQALLELSRVRGGQFASWGRKQLHSTEAYSSCNCEDKHAVSPLAAVTAAADLKPGRGSPTTPLRWSGNERISATASPSSDSAAGLGPCDLTLRPKVERKLGVHNPSNGKGHKKKTLAQLKELFNGLSLQKEEMEKEKEKIFNSFQSLTDENKFLKQKLALKLGKKRQHQLPIQSPTITSNLKSLKVSIGHDALESSSRAFALPDLNIPMENVEDLSNNMSNNMSIDVEVVEVDSKAIVAAMARKYRMECLRLKSMKAPLRCH